MTRAARHLLVPALAAARPGQPDRRRRRRRRRRAARAHRRRARRAPAGRSAAGRADRVRRDVELYGPGDVVGIDRRGDRPHGAARTGSPTSSPTTSRSIEFYDEDLPWRYTPAAPDPTTGRLRPWLALVVLEEGEFTEPRSNIAGDRCRSSTSRDARRRSAGRRAVGVGARARQPHLAATTARCVSDDMGAVAPAARRRCSRRTPTSRYSRLVCPRRLAPSTAYHAFLMPTFETGRLAGLGLDPRRAPERDQLGLGRRTRAAPSGRRSPTTTAGTSGPARRATSSTWCGCCGRGRSTAGRASATWTSGAPGSSLPGIDDPDLAACSGSAARCRCPTRALHGPTSCAAGPASTSTGTSRTRTRSRSALARLVNLADDYPPSGRRGRSRPARSTPPLYGHWHALTKRLLVEPRRPRRWPTPTTTGCTS